MTGLVFTVPFFGIAIPVTVLLYRCKPASAPGTASAPVLGAVPRVLRPERSSPCLQHIHTTDRAATSTTSSPEHATPAACGATPLRPAAAPGSGEPPGPGATP